MKKRKLLIPIMIAMLILPLTILMLTGCNSPDPKTEPVSAISNAFITIDINPAIELLTDEKGKIVSFTPTNEDADVLLIDVNLIGKTPEEAIDIILNECRATGYIQKNQNNAVLVSVIAETDAQTLINSLNKKVSDFSKESNFNIDILTSTENDDLLKPEAETLNISVAKLRLIKLAMTYDNTLLIETAKGMPIKDLNQIIINARLKTAHLISAELIKEFELMKAKFEAEEELKEVEILLTLIKESTEDALSGLLGDLGLNKFIQLFEEKFNEIKSINFDDIDLASASLSAEEMSKIEELMTTYISSQEAFKACEKGKDNKDEMKTLLRARKNSKEALDNYLDKLEDKYGKDIDIHHNNTSFTIIVDSDYDDVFENIIENKIEEMYKFFKTFKIDIDKIEDMFENELDRMEDEYESQVELKLSEYKKSLDANLNAIKDSLTAEKNALKLIYQ